MRKFIVETILIYFILGFVSCATGSGTTGETVPLDQAIRVAAEDIENRLETGSKIALLNFTSPSERFSEYVLETLSEYLVNGGKLVVVDRKELDIIRQEEQFQLSGEVSDESAQAIGKKLGAQVIVSGSLSNMGKSYLFRIKTLAVETAAIVATSSSELNIRENRVAFLLADAKPAAKQPSAQPLTQPEEEPVPEGLLYEVIARKSITITKYIGSDINVHIPASIDGLPVTTIGGLAFYECKSITSVTIPSSVTMIEISAFQSCDSLTSVTIPSSVTTIEFQAFAYCENLTNITIPSSVISIGDAAFILCKMTSVTIPSSVTTIGEGAFWHCTNLMNINVETRNSVYMSVDGVLFDKNGRTLICYPAGKRGGVYVVPSSVTRIGIGAFISSKHLTSVTSSSSVTIIDPFAFSNCISLTDVTLSRRTKVGREAFPDNVRIQYRD